MEWRETKRSGDEARTDNALIALHVRRMAADVAAMRFRLALQHVMSLVGSANFQPNQPRIPIGMPGGGRWTVSGDGAVGVEVGNRDGDSRRYLIDLLDHEGRKGTHTIERHVGKTDAYLIRRLETERLTSPFATLALAQAGTF